MIAIVAGHSLGLDLSSFATLGPRGPQGTADPAGQGRSGESAVVNAANGNLVLQQRDDLLVGRGLDIAALRTYNSQGLLDDDNADNWTVAAFGQRVRLASGALGASNSTLVRTDRDGSQALYTWDPARNAYLSAEGAGAFDTLRIDAAASQLVWTDGDSGRIERYQDAGDGRLLSTTDADGQTVRLAYNANGRLVHQKNFEYGVLKSEVAYDRYDAAGNLVSTLSADIQGLSQSRTINEVEAAEGYRQHTSITESAVVAGPGAGQNVQRGGVAYGYDANGNLNFVGDAGQTKLSQRTHRFVNDAQGHALYAYYANEQTPEQHTNEQRQLVVNGEVLGRYGAMADQRFEALPTPVFTSQSDFSFGYQPIDGSYPAGSPGTYAVGEGDTLQTIAKGAYGDAKLWYLIADANNLSSSADLRAGQVLTIPTRVGSGNDEDSFRPYDPSKILGNTSPSLIAMPGQQEGCGAVGQIVVAVVIAVVAVATQQYYLANYGTAIAAGEGTVALSGAAASQAVAAGAATWSSGSLAAGGLIGGAVGSIAGQAVGIGIGAQDSFSWRQVALQAISGGVGGFMGSVANGGVGGLSSLSGSGWDATIARAAIGNALTQGAGVITGLQDEFSWRSVAASALGAGVGQAVGGALGSANAFAGLGVQGQRVAIGAASSFAGGVTTAVMRGGRVSATQVAVDVFGNAIGSSIAAITSDTSTRYLDDEAHDRLGGKYDLNGFDAQDDAEVAAEERSRAAATRESAQKYAYSGMPSGDRVMTLDGRYLTPRLVPMTQSYTSLAELDQTMGKSGVFDKSSDEWKALASTDASKQLQLDVMASKRYGVAGRIAALIGAADKPEEIGFTFVPPSGTTVGVQAIRNMMDPATGSLQNGFSRQDLFEAARREGIPIAVQSAGITNSPSQAYSMGYSISTEIALTGQNAVVVSAYNPTHGEKPDVVESSAIKNFSVNTSTVEAVRILTEEAVATNAKIAQEQKTPSLAITQIWGHSEGAAIVTQALSEYLDPKALEHIDLRVLGSPVGIAPVGLHSYVSVWNQNDRVAGLGRWATFTGGVEHSPGFVAGNQANPGSYQSVPLDFVVTNLPDGMTNENHSLQYYLTDPVARSGLNLVPMRPPVAQLYSRSYWLKGE